MDLVDFLFCPVHGVFRPQHWPIIAPMLGGLIFTGKRLIIDGAWKRFIGGV